MGGGLHQDAPPLPGNMPSTFAVGLLVHVCIHVKVTTVSVLVSKSVFVSRPVRPPAGMRLSPYAMDPAYLPQVHTHTHTHTHTHSYPYCLFNNSPLKSIISFGSY